MIYENSEGGWLRRDICDGCWKEEDKKAQFLAEKPEIYFLWKSKIPVVPPKSPADSTVVEKLFEMLRLALAGDSEVQQAEAFILAMLLKRKKKLIERKEFKPAGGVSCLLYEDTDTQEIFSVPKVGLEKLEVHKIQDQIQKSLHLQVCAT